MIYIDYDNELDEPADPLVVVRPGIKFRRTLCYSGWWGSQERLDSGRVRISMSGSQSGRQCNEGQVNTLRNAVTWARSQGYDMRLCEVPEAIVHGRFYDEKMIHALELQYLEHESAEKIFYALCHMRLPSSEFTRGELPNDLSYRKLLEYIFKTEPADTNHLPIKDGWNIWGSGFRSDNEIVPPSNGVLAGRGLYAFWSQQKNRTWDSVPISDYWAGRTVGIRSSEWLEFYRNWILTDDKDADY